MKNLEKLKKAIIKEIPEIVELKFGCEITNVEVYNEVTKRYEEEPSGIVIKDLRDEFLFLEIDSGDQLQYSIGSNDKVRMKIVGRPITLADVLRVLRKKNEYGSKVDDRGIFWITDMVMELPGKKKYAWNLSENNLDLQSEKTIDFLTNLITKEDIK